MSLSKLNGFKDYLEAKESRETEPLPFIKCLIESVQKKLLNEAEIDSILHPYDSDKKVLNSAVNKLVDNFSERDVFKKIYDRCSKWNDYMKKAPHSDHLKGWLAGMLGEEVNVYENP